MRRSLKTFIEENGKIPIEILQKPKPKSAIKLHSNFLGKMPLSMRKKTKIEEKRQAWDETIKRSAKRQLAFYRVAVRWLRLCDKRMAAVPLAYIKTFHYRRWQNIAFKDARDEQEQIRENIYHVTRRRPDDEAESMLFCSERVLTWQKLNEVNNGTHWIGQNEGVWYENRCACDGTIRSWRSRNHDITYRVSEKNWTFKIHAER